jgi:hypothetical protein
MLIVELFIFSQVSAGHAMTEMINLSDNSDDCVEVIRRESGGFLDVKIVGVKRILSAAFSECGSIEASTSKPDKALDD